jgi:hypothetical protein
MVYGIEYGIEFLVIGIHFEGNIYINIVAHFILSEEIFQHMDH